MQIRVRELRIRRAEDLRCTSAARFLLNLATRRESGGRASKRYGYGSLMFRIAQQIKIESEAFAPKIRYER